MGLIEADVAIVGFGPVGAALAGLLGKRGLRVVVFDSQRDVFALPRAAHIDHQGLRVLQELGCLDDLIPEMIPNPGLDFVTADRRLLFQIPSTQPSVSGLAASMYFHQPTFDRRIRSVAGAMSNVHVRLGATVVGLEQSPESVKVKVLSADHTSDDLEVSWVVGCDGAGSAVRDWLAIPLEDLQFDEKWIVVDLLLKRAVDTLPDRALNVCDPRRPLTAIPIPKGRFRFELQLMPGEDPDDMQSPARVFELLKSWLPPASADIERSAVYVFHGLLAQAWRDRRVFLAGDAAHQMPPFLGQGMCSGLRDAANIAWKLDHVIRSRAPVALLDTYQQERKPHVRAIIEAAVEYGRLTCETDPVVAAERDRRWLSDPAPPARKLRFSLPSLRPGPLILRGGGELFVQPAVVGAGGRLDDVVGQRFLVLGRSKPAGHSLDWWIRDVGAVVASVDELGEFREELLRWLDLHLTNVVIVRPDRYVLGAGDNLDSFFTPAVQTLLTGASRQSTVRDASALGAHSES